MPHSPRRRATRSWPSSTALARSPAASSDPYQGATMTTRCAIMGSGNIGTDLLIKMQRSEVLEPVAMVGIDPDSNGLARAAELGIDTSADGVDWIVDHADGIDMVFEATAASVHRDNA